MRKQHLNNVTSTILKTDRDKEVFFKEILNPSEPNKNILDAFNKRSDLIHKNL